MKSIFLIISILNLSLSFDPSNLTTKEIYHFYDNSEQEKLKNLNLVNNELKDLEEQYTSCVINLKDVNFTKDEIDYCLGPNFEKIT